MVACTDAHTEESLHMAVCIHSEVVSNHMGMATIQYGREDIVFLVSCGHRAGIDLGDMERYMDEDSRMMLDEYGHIADHMNDGQQENLLLHRLAHRLHCPLLPRSPRHSTSLDHRSMCTPTPMPQLQLAPYIRDIDPMLPQLHFHLHFLMPLRCFLFAVPHSVRAIPSCMSSAKSCYTPRNSRLDRQERMAPDRQHMEHSCQQEEEVE